MSRFFRRNGLLQVVILLVALIFVYWHSSRHLQPSAKADEGGPESTPQNEARIEVKTVSFTGAGLDGLQLYDWWDDSPNWNNQPDSGETLGATPISAPEWDKDSSKNKFAMESINVQWHVAARFKIQSDAGIDAPFAWATASNSNLNMATPSSPVTLVQDSSTGLWGGTFQIANASSTLDCFDVTWTWHIKIGSEVYTDNSSHSVGVGSPSLSYSSREGETGKPALAMAENHAPRVTQPTVQDCGPQDPLTDLLLCDSSPVNYSTPQDPQLAFANVIKAVSEATKGQHLDPTVAANRDKICDVVLKNMNCFNGKYEFPNQNWLRDPTDVHDFDAIDLLKFGTGSCGNWADLMATTLKAEYNIAVTVAAPQCVEVDHNPPPPGWSNNTECFQTGNVTPQGGTAKSFVFGDHAFITYQGTCYDPSFSVEFVGKWYEYMHDKVIAKNALPDATKVIAWTRCDAIDNPNNVLWKNFDNAGGNELNLQDRVSASVEQWMVAN